MKVAISTSSFGSIDTSPLDLLKSKNIELKYNPFGRKLSENEIIDHLEGMDGLLAGLEPLNHTVFSNSPKLKAIARVGIGMDNVDIVAAKTAGIKISNTPSGPTSAVAEMTLAAGLILSRKILPANRALHNKCWEKKIGLGLKEINVLFIGYGRIGKKTAELFNAIGSQILVCDPVINNKDLSRNEKLVSLDEGLAIADIISIHAQTNQTILSYGEFNSMKDGIIILNSARGNLINESALIKNLESGKVSSAWLDAFSDEPYKGRLTDFDQVLLTPHMSTYTKQCRRDMEISAVNNLLSDLGLE